MTPDQIHGALIIAAYVLGTIAAIGLASLLVRAIDRRSHDTDAKIAEDTRDFEAERAQRIRDAKRQDQERFEQALGLRGVDGGRR